MKTSLLHETLEAGRVIRYHAVPSVHNPLQNVAQHSWNVAILVMHITGFDCSLELLMEALLHDTGEAITGDIPYTVKRDNPKLKMEFLELEIKARKEHTICAPINLSEMERAVLKVADTLDGFIWCALHEDKRGPVEDRWHHAYLVARDKFRNELAPSEWQRADQLFTNYGGILRDAGNEVYADGTTRRQWDHMNKVDAGEA